MARTLGSKDKPKRALVMRLKQVYGEEFDVIMNMAHNATNLQSIANGAMDTLHSATANGVPSDEDDAKVIVQALRGASATANDAISAWDKIAVYVQPKLKHVEVTGEGGGAIDTHYTVEFIEAAGNAETEG